MLDTIREAIQSGLHIIHGLHVHLGDMPEFRELATRYGVRIWDTRKPPPTCLSGPDAWRARSPCPSYSPWAAIAPWAK